MVVRMTHSFHTFTVLITVMFAVSYFLIRQYYVQVCDSFIFPPFTDINECLEFENLCMNGICDNIVGIFQCICNQGM